MLIQPITESINKSVHYDFIHKYSFNNYYNFYKKKNINIVISKSVTNQIKQISIKKSDTLLKILVLHYLMYSRKPYIKYAPIKQKLKGNISLKINLSFSKAILFQMINYIDYIFSKYFFYSAVITVLIKYIVLYFFKIKKKNFFIFKILKL